MAGYAFRGAEPALPGSWRTDGDGCAQIARDRAPGLDEDVHAAAQGADRNLMRTYLLERIDEAAVVQVYADGFKSLALRDKILVWHLYQATLAGRDIFYDQRYAHNLDMRDVLEALVTHLESIEPATRAEILRYTKLFWINTGPYHTLT